MRFLEIYLNRREEVNINLGSRRNLPVRFTLSRKKVRNWINLILFDLNLLAAVWLLHSNLPKVCNLKGRLQSEWPRGCQDPIIVEMYLWIRKSSRSIGFWDINSSKAVFPRKIARGRLWQVRRKARGWRLCVRSWIIRSRKLMRRRRCWWRWWNLSRRNLSRRRRRKRNRVRREKLQWSRRKQRKTVFRMWLPSQGSRCSTLQRFSRWKKYPAGR